MYQFFRKSFQNRIEKANRNLSKTLNRLSVIQDSIRLKMERNSGQINKLTDENKTLEGMQTKIGKQIGDIGKFVG